MSIEQTQQSKPKWNQIAKIQPNHLVKEREMLDSKYLG